MAKSSCQRHRPERRDLLDAWRDVRRPAVDEQVLDVDHARLVNQEVEQLRIADDLPAEREGG